MPCGDELEVPVFSENSILIVEHESKTNEENCSPICFCTCCGQLVIAIKMVSFTVQAPTLEFLNPVAVYHFKLKQRDQNIWQPPKLSINS
jgi:hypothetical protein